MNRRTLLASFAATSLVAARSVIAQPSPVSPQPSGNRRAPPSGRVLRLGVLIWDRWRGPWRLPGLLETLGYVEGRNLIIEMRSFDTDLSRSKPMAADLVRMGVSVLHTAGTPLTAVLHDATRTIPIVTSLNDPVAAGYATKDMRPLGNITGLCNQHPATHVKAIELLRILVPRLDRVMICAGSAYSGNDADTETLLRPYGVAARASGLAFELRIVEPAGYDRLFTEMKRRGIRAAVLQFSSQDKDMKGAASLAIHHGVVAISNDPGYGIEGGLITFGMRHEKFYERGAAMIDKAFRGVKVAEIPWELPDRPYLAVNLRSAKAMGLTIPPEVLLRADHVIE